VNPRKRYLVPAGVLVVSIAVTGCANTLGFSTATKFGLDISQQADQNIDVTMGYDRVEVASIPSPDKADAGKDDDTYSVIGIFNISYGGLNDPLVLHQFFATGMAASDAASDPELQKVFAARAAELCGDACKPPKEGAK